MASFSKKKCNCNLKWCLEQWGKPCHFGTAAYRYMTAPGGLMDYLLESYEKAEDKAADNRMTAEVLVESHARMGWQRERRLRHIKKIFRQ